MQKKRKDWNIIKSFGQLAKMMRQQDGKCHWCKRDMVLLRSKSGNMHFMTDNVATRDHVHARPLKQRHGNQPSEIVLACYRCNQDRAYVQSELTMQLHNITPFVKYIRGRVFKRKR